MVLKFNEYLKEEFDEVLDVDAKYITNNVDALNSDLDALTEKPYQNAPILLNQIRGTLERYGIILPPSANPHFMNLSAELVYMLGESNYHLYMVYDTNDDGFVDGYAQIVDDSELQDLIGMDSDELINSDRNPVNIRPSTWYAKRDDDSGNSNEY